MMDSSASSGADFPDADLARVRAAIDAPGTAYDRAIRALYRHTRKHLADTEQWPSGPQFEMLKANLAVSTDKAFDDAYPDQLVSFLAWRDHAAKKDRAEKVAGNWAVWGFIGSLGTLALVMVLYMSRTFTGDLTVLGGFCGVWLLAMIALYVYVVKR
jgi:hypothetical protein